jgi:sodium/bile acid cotransporter 7
MIAFLKRNWFLLGIAAVVALALLAPRLGVMLNPAKVLSTAAVVAIFVLSGLSLPSEEMRAGLRKLRVHAFLQLFIFVAVPVYFVATSGWLREAMGGRLIVGVYALAVFPTTISSCIVLTQMAGGSVATTIFNAVLANMLGVFVSPLLLTLLLSRTGQGLPAGEIAWIFLRLALKVLLPFAAGQLLRLRLHAFAGRHRKRFSTISGCLVLLVIFLAFCRAAGSGVLRGHAAGLAGPFAYLAGSNVLLMLAAFGAARLLHFDRGDVTSVVFTAPQKTLAMGVPLLTTYFASQPELLGIAMIPSLFYHPWQLLTAGVAKGLLARGETGEAPATD